MLSKNETFAPPTASEEWTDRQFGVILNYLSEYQVPYSGQIYLKWLAAPYISIWNSVCTSGEASTVWIMHNKLQTDHFTGASDASVRDVIGVFGDRWIKAGRDLQKNPSLKLDHPDEYDEPEKYAAQLVSFGEMFKSVAEDTELEF
ncbi:MAG: DUF4826 family protein [Victivallales bacterium]|nr:DUF4826 family protein [Victivallales bacterium]